MATDNAGRIVRPLLQTVPLVIAAGCLVAIFNVGPRASMGFFLTPMSNEFGWNREVFALAIALQNLVWGIGQPFAGMLADRYGTARVVTGGALLYALGLVLMSYSTTPGSLQLTAGVLAGLGIAGSSFTMVLPAFARLLPEKLRPLSFGLATAAGSLGQFIFAPLGQAFIAEYGWQFTLVAMGAVILVIPALSFVIRGRPEATPTVAGERDQTIREALVEAFGHGSFRLLVAGFFVCGFQVVFIAVHLPAYLGDAGIPVVYGGYAIGLIGLFNVFGSITSGVLTGLMSNRMILAGLYLLRAAAIVVFLMVPISIPSVLVFSAVIGFLWLSTVPPTQQLVATMFGRRYMATLFGFVFFSHQVGSFLGVWLGGVLYDLYGSYDAVWWLSVALGVFAAIVHLPIVERPIQRQVATA